MSPRILAVSDLHCGAGGNHRRDHLADQEAVLEQIVEHARGCDLVLIAGDVFHRPKPTPAELHLFGRFVRALDAAGVPAIAVHGNVSHDQVNGDEPTALALFASDGFRVSRHPELFAAAGISVVTLPSVPVHRLIAATDGRDRDEIHEWAAVMLVDIARDLRDQTFDDRPCVLLGHWHTTAALAPNGYAVPDFFHEPILETADLAAIGFDHVVLGHNHRPQTFVGGFHVGSPMVMDFGEAGFEHGCWIFDTDDPSEPEFVPLADRAFVTVDVDLELECVNVPDKTDVVAARIAERFPLTDAIVRVTYKATEEQHRRVDHPALLRLLDDAGVHRVHGSIRWEPVRETRARVEGIDETLDPAEAVQAWCDANGVDGERAEALHALTREWLGAREGVTA